MAHEPDPACEDILASPLEVGGKSLLQKPRLLTLLAIATGYKFGSPWSPSDPFPRPTDPTRSLATFGPFIAAARPATTVVAVPGWAWPARSLVGQIQPRGPLSLLLLD